MTNQGAMKIKKYKFLMKEWVRPLNNREMFSHCAGGRPECSLLYFEETVRPVLMAHGISEIRITQD
jgi:hypothetical protein